MPKPIIGSTKDMYVVPGTNKAVKYGGTGKYTTSSVGFKKEPKKEPTLPKTNPITPQNKGGNGYSSGAAVSGGGSSAPDTGYMQSYLNQIQSAISDAQASAKAAQERAEAQLKAAQEAQRKAREEAYARSTAQQQQNYEYGRGQVNDATDSALRQAYINRMQQQRNLNQLLSAQGLNGGASETTTAGMLNNYANSRNALETERTAQLAKLMNTYQNNLTELANQKASGDAADLTAYQTNLGNLAANNANNMISLIQGYANMAASMPQLRQRFNTTTGQWEYSYE